MRRILFCLLILCFVFAKGQDNEATLISNGRSAAGSRNYEMAMNCFNKAIEMNPNSASAYYNRGMLKFEIKKYNEAIEDFNKVIELKPENKRAYLYRGTSKMELYKFNESITDFNTAIELDTNYSEAYNSRGVAKYKQDKINESMKDFEEALKVLKSNPEKKEVKKSWIKQNIRLIKQERYFDKDYSKHRYGPFYKMEKDSTICTLPKVGHYLFAGGGMNAEGNAGGYAGFASYSLAYKSHMLSLSDAGGEIAYSNSQIQSYRTNYVGLLVGESVRYKYAMFSVSVGAAFFNYWGFNPYIKDRPLYYSWQSGISYGRHSSFDIPIELKYYHPVRNGLGWGIFISKSIVFSLGNSPYYFGACFVIGKKNRIIKAIN